MKNASVIGANIIEKEGKFLFVQESKEHVKGLWNLPAGHLEPKENLTECAIREAKEETGLEVKPKKLVSISQHYLTESNT